jgi:hypothetical protein
MEGSGSDAQPDTVISSYAREEINATALVGDLSLKISDDGQCELIASIQTRISTKLDVVREQVGTAARLVR